MIFIAVGTPPGVGGEANMTYVEQVGRQVAEHMTSYRLLVEKSTVPAKTSEYLKRTVLKYLRADTDFDVASNPEFLREGTAIEDATHPDRIVVGVESQRAGDLLEEIYRPILKKGGGEFLRMSVTSAELTKHASNSFLAMKISYINAVARICELAGADVGQVAKGMGLDPRIGPRFLSAGVGYGGSCFPKDVDAFVRLADALGHEFKLLKEVQAINKTQREYVMKKIKQELWVVQDKKIAIFAWRSSPRRTTSARPRASTSCRNCRKRRPSCAPGIRWRKPSSRNPSGTRLRPGPLRMRQGRRSGPDPDGMGRGQEDRPEEAQERHGLPRDRGRPQYLQSRRNPRAGLHLPQRRPQLSPRTSRIRRARPGPLRPGVWFTGSEGEMLDLWTSFCHKLNSFAATFCLDGVRRIANPMRKPG